MQLTMGEQDLLLHKAIHLLHDHVMISSRRHGTEGMLLWDFLKFYFVFAMLKHQEYLLIISIDKGVILMGFFFLFSSIKYLSR
jgi:hypothetical protein